MEAQRGAGEEGASHFAGHAEGVILQVFLRTVEEVNGGFSVNRIDDHRSAQR